MTGLPAFDSALSLGQRVRSLRTAFGLSQQELARRARVSQARISQIESDQTSGPLPLRMLCDLADGLGVDVDVLVDSDPIYDDVDLDAVRAQSPLQASAPRPISSLVGRMDDLAVVVGALRDGVRLLTLVGPGGVGKTQLALHACRELVGDFGQGTFFVSLAACVDPGSVVLTIARGLGLRERGTRPLRGRLLSDLPPGRILLVFDNAEQAVSPVSALSSELLAAYPDVSLLVTSRAPLNVRGERQHEVCPLAFPDSLATVSAANAETAPAIELFVRHAREALPAFALTDANAPKIAAICKRLDGLPLAIELAAPRVRLYSPAQLLNQLERQLTFVNADSPALPHRQRSLRANIAWSFDLLDPERQALLRRLAVFFGGFTLDAAAEVARENGGRFSDADGSRSSLVDPDAAVARSVSILLDQHLLTRSEDGHGVPRFGMLETIHEYAWEQLEVAGEAPEFRERHLTWCRSLAERSVPKMFTAEESAWLNRLHQEADNLRAALGWAFDSGQGAALEEGLRLAGALTDYWYISGLPSEGLEWLTRAVTLSADRAPSIGRARSLVGACLIEQTQGSVEAARAHAEDGLTMARSLDDQPTIGRALLILGNLAIIRAEYDRAQMLHEEALAYFTRLNNHAWKTLALLNLGINFHRQGRLEQAAIYARDALAIGRAIGNRWDTITALALLGDIARDYGELERARALFVESLDIARRHGSGREIAYVLSGLGAVAVAAGEFEQAARLLGGAETLFRRFEMSIPPPLRPDWITVVARIQAGLTADQFARAWASATPEQAALEVLAANRSGRDMDSRVR